MNIPPFLAGVLTTLFFEAIGLIVAAFVISMKKK